jgi:hypothetical protein
MLLVVTWKNEASEDCIANISDESKQMMDWLESHGFRLKELVEVDEKQVFAHYRFLLPDGEYGFEDICEDDFGEDDFDLELSNAKYDADIYEVEEVYIDVVFINAITGRIKVYITNEIDIDTGQLELSQSTQSIEAFVGDAEGIKNLYKMLTNKELKAEGVLSENSK